MKKALHPIFGPISGGRYLPKGGFADVWIRQLFIFGPGVSEGETMRLSRIEAKVLTALAGMGPCSNKALADALGWPPAEVYQIVYRLRQKGAAKYGYDATEQGREVVRRTIGEPSLFQMQMLTGD